MQRALVCAGLGLGFMLAASSTYAGEVELSVENRIGGDSNVLRAENPDADGTWELTPRFGVHDDGENVYYGLGYQPTYRNFFETAGIDGVDHYADGRVGWAITPADRIDVTGSYYNGRLLRSDIVAGSLNTVDLNDRAQLKQSNATLSYRRTLSNRLSLGLTGAFDDFDAPTKLGSQTDSRAYTGRISANYDLSPLTEVGLLASVRRRENRAVDSALGPMNPNTGTTPFLPRVSSSTDVWDVLFSASRILTPTIRVSAQVGPSFLRQQQFPGSSKKPVPGGAIFDHEESRNVSVFASASMTKEWKASDLSFSYVRSEARSGSVSSGSSISDQVSLNGNYRINDHWVLRALGSWNRLDQIVSEQGAQGKATLTGYQAIGTVEYALSRRILLIGQYSFYRQVNDSGLQGGLASFIDSHIGFLGIRYTFEPLAY